MFGSGTANWLFLRKCLPALTFLFVTLGVSTWVNTRTLLDLQESSRRVRGGGAASTQQHVATTTTQQEANNNIITQSREIVSLPILANSSASGSVVCPEGLVPVKDSLADAKLVFQNRKIPRIIHLTGKSRCLHPAMAENVESWRLKDHSLFFHDDAAMDQLLYRDWPEFPHLKYVLKCVLYGGAVKADIWRLLVLWEYGGIYADFDSRPSLFNETTILPDDEAFLVVERNGLPSQWFMSASPRHPLLYSIIQELLLNLIKLDDVGDLPIVWTTGPGAVSGGFSKFLGPHVKRQHPDVAGLYIGAYGHTVRLVGNHTNENEYIERNIYETRLRKDGEDYNDVKNQAYASMGMSHLTTFGYRDESNRKNETCIWRMWREEMKVASQWTPSW